MVCLDACYRTPNFGIPRSGGTISAKVCSYYICLCTLSKFYHFHQTINASRAWRPFILSSAMSSATQCIALMALNALQIDAFLRRYLSLYVLVCLCYLKRRGTAAIHVVGGWDDLNRCLELMICNNLKQTEL